MIIVFVAALVIMAVLGMAAAVVIFIDLSHAFGQWRRDRARRRAGFNLPGSRVIDLAERRERVFTAYRRGRR